MQHTKHRWILLSCTIILLLIFTSLASAQKLSDFKIKYSRMAISEIKLKNRTALANFYRHNVELELGIAQGFIGVNYQYATKDEKTTSVGENEDGIMLTAGYNFIFSRSFRLNMYGRIGVWGDTNPAQPLYATDTDFSVNIVTFIPEGIGAIAGKPLFPSSYVGAIVNQYGRVQNIAGLGFWWNGFDVYATAFLSLNGLENIDNPEEKYIGKQFAVLKNSGLSFAVNYHLRGFVFGVVRNIAIENGGNDFTLNLQYQYFF